MMNEFTYNIITMKNQKSYSLYLLMALILFQGISGLFGGTVLVIDPTGELLQMPLSMLKGSPFRDFRVPGIILLTILGIIPTIVFYGLWKRSSWAWTGALMVSAALIIWIGVEIWMVGYHSEPPLQLVYGLLGLILLLLTLLPSVRHNFRELSKRR
jgi:hypothetical protein